MCVCVCGCVFVCLFVCFRIIIFLYCLFQFEEMMDRLEKNCAQNFASQDRKELLLKDDDELSIAIYDYWLSKRLKTVSFTVVVQ